MTTTNGTAAPIRHADRFFIGGEWVVPSSDSTIEVIDSATEELYFRVPEARPADIDRAEDIGQIWPRESGARYVVARYGAEGIAGGFARVIAEVRPDVVSRLWGAWPSRTGQ